MGRWDNILKLFPSEDVNCNKVTLCVSMLASFGSGNLHNLSNQHNPKNPKQNFNLILHKQNPPTSGKTTERDNFHMKLNFIKNHQMGSDYSHQLL